MGFAMVGAELAYQGAELSDAAWRTHVEALIWSRQRMLDGKIPKRDLPRFAYSTATGPAVAELVAHEWWQDCGDHWLLVFGFEWQSTKKQIEQRREADRVRQARRRAHQTGDHSQCDSRCHAVTPDVTPDVTPEKSREAHLERAQLERVNGHE